MTARKPKPTLPLHALPLLLLMTACASPPVTSSADCPQLPSKPAARQPAPPQSYSSSAASDIERWQQQLTATLPTSASAKPPGRSE